MLEAQHLTRVVGGGKVILHDLSMVALPGEFIAIVGGAGAGKSTLLGALSGARPATSGRVLIDGVLLSARSEALRKRIGFVPQDDIIHRELTVERALQYAAELRLPTYWTPEQRQARVEEVLTELEMQPHRKTVVANLSGGQRKRVSIGVELLTRPGLLFLDEPTSGLDPALEAHVMALLRRLADQGRTIVLITHVTRNINRCDRVLFLAPGGRMAFFGAPADALRYFGVTEFEEIYDQIEQNGTPEEWERRFRETDLYQREVEDRMVHGESEAATPPALVAPRTGESIRQYRVLTRRYAEIMLRDRRNLAILLLQAPLIGVLLWALFSANVFSRPQNVWLVTDRLSRPVLFTPEVSQIAKQVFAQRQDPHATGPKPTLIFYSGRDCPRFGSGFDCSQDGSNGDGNAAKAAQLMFILAAVAVWLGTLNAVREIAKEDAIYRRERMVGLRILPYIGSKLSVLAVLAVVQTALLLIVVAMHIGISAGGAFGVYIALLCGAAAAIAIALAVSAAVSNPDRAIFAAPLIMLPQIFFAGLLVPVASLGFIQPLAALVPARWTFEAASRAADIANVAVFLPALPYHDALDGSAWPGILALLGLIVAFSGLAVFLQQRKDRR